MSDPLSFTASVVGIAAPTIRCIGVLLREINNIADAPETLLTLKSRLQALQQALRSLEAIPREQWESLGQPIVDQSRSAIAACDKTCKELQDLLDRTTRHSIHSESGKLALRDRLMIGFVKHGRVKSAMEELQHSLSNITAVVATATLHSSLQKQCTLGDSTPEPLEPQGVANRPEDISTVSYHASVVDNYFGSKNEGAQIGEFRGVLSPGGITSREESTETPTQQSPGPTPVQLIRNHFGQENDGTQLGKHEGEIEHLIVIDSVESIDVNTPEATDNETPKGGFIFTINAPSADEIPRSGVSHTLNFFGQNNRGLQIGNSYGKLIIGKR